MALIEQGKLDKLLPASEAKAVAESAIDATNLAQVAYAINTAANTGETEAVIMSLMTPNTISELESNGYKIMYKKTAAQSTVVVSWGNN